MPSPASQVQLTIVEDVLGELIVLEAPAAQIAIGPQLSDTAPVVLGTAAAGTASSAARGDHVHAHGNLAGSSLHALASTSAAGFMSAAQVDLLAGATDDDAASTLVRRDSLGDFSAGTITANLTGTASAIADNTVTSAKIVDGSIVNADINASAEIAVSKLADGSARQLLQTAANGTDVEWSSNIDVPGTLDVTGAATFDAAVTIEGDLTVNGTETIINTQTLTVEDKNIELGKIDTPTDALADGGGITLKGTTDKTINWVDVTDAWTFSEHVNIASAKEYRIAGIKVLDATSLGSAVVTSSLTSVGTIGTGVWQGTAIDKTYLDATLVSTGDTGTVTSTMIADGTIVDADVNASAAIAGTKISPNFGSQTITTTGVISPALGTAAAPSIAFTLDTGIYSPGADQVAVATNGTGRLFVNSTGNIGLSEATPTARLHLSGTSTAGGIKIVDSSASSAAPGIEVIGKRSDSNNSSSFAGKLLLSKNRTDAAINSANVLGSVAFGGNHTDGTEANILYSASIVGAADGAFNSATDMPTALVFNTGATGRAPDTASVTTGSERLRITSAGTVRVTAVLSAANTTSNTSPTNSNASTTATASSLLNGIRTGTPTAGIDLQVPTGTNMDAAFADLQNNQAFEWSVINLAAATHTITITANDDHTVVGNMIVAAASSGRFLTRKTATNTFITYRIA
jgi:hypothetical protein